MLQSSTTVKTGRGTYAYNVHEILTLKTKHKWCTQMQKSFGKYYCYCQSKTIKNLKRKDCCRFKWITTWGSAFKIIVSDPREGWGERACKWSLIGIITTQIAALAFFSLENLQGFSLLSDHDKHSSSCSDFWGLQGSRVRGQQVSGLPIGTSLGSLLSDPYEPYLHFLLLSWKECSWKLFFPPSVLKRRWRGGRLDVFIFGLSCPDQCQGDWERVLHQD